MPMLPFAALWVLLAVACVVNVALRSRHKSNYLLNAAAVAGALGLWVWGRPTSGEPLAAASLLTYDFAVPSAVWQLTGVVLLALLAILIRAWLAARGEAADTTPNGAGWPMLLGLSVLPFLWAAGPQTAATMLALFTAVAGLCFWRSRGNAPDAGRKAGPAATLLLGPLLLLWFADAVALSGTAAPFWAGLSGVAALVAGAVLAGAWPLGAWREFGLSLDEPTALAFVSLPPVAGAAVFLPVVGQTFNGGGQMATAVILGCLSLLLAVRGAWRGGQSARALGLAAALSGLLVLAAVFADEAVLLSAVRLVVFLPLLAWFLAPRAAGEGVAVGWPAAVGVGLVWLFALGLPLTVGFGTVAGLYSAWQAAGYLVLVPILCLLLFIWSVLLFRPVLAAVRDRSVSSRAGGLLAAVVCVLPLVALVQWNVGQMAGMSAVVWLALLLPIVAGPVVAWALGGWLDAVEWPGDVFALPEQASPVRDALGRGWRFLGEAIADALGTLEGPNGLIWVLIIVVALFLLS